MPNTTSAEKALRQTKRRRIQNLKAQKETREVIKTYKKLLASGDKNKAKEALPLVYKKLDKLAKKKVIKKNKASRLKSRLSKKLSS
ncbi:30S ribosomal protein S20 [Candidatus Jorgensenbacteria bacterium RIFCSPLOWO2_01_FULL_45_25b]|uniref:Small ribosomal subunit protein bS20 n=1 Tax=Candidatus Jorgensenbacteria bacterium RIFCSPLOWO2_01_FULL_45_25b TaxID=1798471 RepID=A0A1F6BVB0_9BACT|nr:MAG: 30S ribosomal protein S20 [Candidatus Jorgensenbacteria bacterium RIFCSPLOWO2_01_FULL_45_25b]